MASQSGEHRANPLVLPLARVTIASVSLRVLCLAHPPHVLPSPAYRAPQGTLYGELARFVLRILGVRARGKRGGAGKEGPPAIGDAEAAWGDAGVQQQQQQQRQMMMQQQGGGYGMQQGAYGSPYGGQYGSQMGMGGMGMGMGMMGR